MIHHYCYRLGFLEEDAEMRFRCKMFIRDPKAYKGKVKKQKTSKRQRKKSNYQGALKKVLPIRTSCPGHKGQSCTLLPHSGSGCKLLWEGCNLRQKSSLKLRQIWWGRQLDADFWPGAALLLTSKPFLEGWSDTSNSTGSKLKNNHLWCQ